MVGEATTSGGQAGAGENGTPAPHASPRAIPRPSPGPGPVPDIAVIIPHYDDVARLQRCLAALDACEGRADTEIVVVDNASPADIETLAADWPGVRVVPERTRGAGSARNRGVSETRAPRLFFLDADCVPARDWLVAGRRALDTAEIVGGRVGTFDETPPPGPARKASKPCSRSIFAAT